MPSPAETELPSPTPLPFLHFYPSTFKDYQYKDTALENKESEKIKDFQDKLLIYLKDNKYHPKPGIKSLETDSFRHQVKQLSKIIQVECMLPKGEIYIPKNAQDITTGFVMDPANIVLGGFHQELRRASGCYKEYLTMVKQGHPVIGIGIGDATKEVRLLTDTHISLGESISFIATDHRNPKARILDKSPQLRDKKWLQYEDLDLSNLDHLTVKLPNLVKDLQKKHQQPPVITLLSVLTNFNSEDQKYILHKILDCLPEGGGLLFGISTPVNPAYFYGQDFQTRFSLLKSQILGLICLHFSSFPNDDFKDVDIHSFHTVHKSTKAIEEYGLENLPECVTSPYGYYSMIKNYIGSGGTVMRIQDCNTQASVIGRYGIFLQGYMQLFAKKKQYYPASGW